MTKGGEGRAALYGVRPINAADFPACEALEREVVPPLIPPTDFARELSGGLANYLLATLACGTIAGMLGVWRMADEAHIVTLAVRSDRRRHGIGELLVICALGQSLKRQARLLTLEVRESNLPARRLYAKCGLAESGRRIQYYRDSGEDAVIMTSLPTHLPRYEEDLIALIRSHEVRWGRSIRTILPTDLLPPRYGMPSGQTNVITGTATTATRIESGRPIRQ